MKKLFTLRTGVIATTLVAVIGVAAIEFNPIILESINDRRTTFLSASIAAITQSATTTGHCPKGYIFNENVCKPRMFDISASTNPNTYLGNTISVGAGRIWSDWKDYKPLQNQVNKITAGKTNDFDKAKAILNWVQTSRPYGCPDTTQPCTDSPANNNADFATIFNSPKGVCFDAAIISTAMLRVAGIPAMPRMIDISHIVTIFYANGIWYSADSTFLINPKTGPNVLVLHASDAAERFIPFVAGELNSYDSSNGKYCDYQFCMGIPFRANRIVPNNKIASAHVTVPAMDVLTYDSNRQVICYFLARNVERSVTGDEIGINSSYNPWKNAELVYSINYFPVGYVTGTIPVSNIGNSSTKVEYRYECSKGYSGWPRTQQEQPIAYANFIPDAGASITITYKDLVRASSTTPVEFKTTINAIKAATEDLGISPTEKPTPSI